MKNPNLMLLNSRDGNVTFYDIKNRVTYTSTASGYIRRTIVRAYVCPFTQDTKKKSYDYFLNRRNNFGCVIKINNERERFDLIDHYSLSYKTRLKPSFSYVLVSK